jgi:hypothetical protein
MIHMSRQVFAGAFDSESGNRQENGSAKGPSVLSTMGNQHRSDCVAACTRTGHHQSRAGHDHHPLTIDATLGSDPIDGIMDSLKVPAWDGLHNNAE